MTDAADSSNIKNGGFPFLAGGGREKDPVWGMPGIRLRQLRNKSFEERRITFVPEVARRDSRRTLRSFWRHREAPGCRLHTAAIPRAALMQFVVGRLLEANTHERLRVRCKPARKPPKPPPRNPLFIPVQCIHRLCKPGPAPARFAAGRWNPWKWRPTRKPIPNTTACLAAYGSA